MFSAVLNFFKPGTFITPLTDKNQIDKLYNNKRWSVFIAITLGYGMFYVCRLSLSVAKKSIVDAGIMNASELGVMGSALFFSYAFGKFFNGFLSDRTNIRRFMSFGLLASAIVNIVIGSTNLFIFFVVLWGFNGWFQSMGAAPSVVAISQWFSNKERGTRYGIWSTSHNIGEAITFVFTAMLIASFGWRFGFWVPGVLGIISSLLLFRFLADRPETYGLPHISDYKNDHGAKTDHDNSIWELQKDVLKNPYVWMLGLASACMYIARYGVTSWGVFFLEAHKGYTTIEASSIASANPIFGVLGTVLAGIVSDKLFNGRRNIPALIFGIIYSVSITVFLFNPKGNPFVDTLSMAGFGFALGALLCYLGGLMAVDICSKKASGAAMGLIGIFSYLAAAAQDAIVGHMIESGKTVVGTETTYDFDGVIIFWITASVLSMFFALTCWKAKIKE